MRPNRPAAREQSPRAQPAPTVAVGRAIVLGQPAPPPQSNSRRHTTTAAAVPASTAVGPPGSPFRQFLASNGYNILHAPVRPPSLEQSASVASLPRRPRRG